MLGMTINHEEGYGDALFAAQVVTTLLGEWSQLLGSGRRLEEVCMWITAVVDRFEMIVKSMVVVLDIIERQCA